MSRTPKGHQVRKAHKIRAYEGMTLGSVSARKMAPASYRTHVLVKQENGTTIRMTREEYANNG